MMPVIERQRQDKLLLEMYRALSPGAIPHVFPAAGMLHHPDTGLVWEWRTRPKRGNASITLLENRLSLKGVELSYRIPLGVIDINDLGLLAIDHASNGYLCRQKFTNHNRTVPDGREEFANGWSGPSYEKFNVVGHSSTRTFHVLVPLSSGPEPAIYALNELMSSRCRVY